MFSLREMPEAGISISAELFDLFLSERDQQIAALETRVISLKKEIGILKVGALDTKKTILELQKDITKAFWEHPKLGKTNTPPSKWSDL